MPSRGRRCEDSELRNDTEPERKKDGEKSAMIT